MKRRRIINPVSCLGGKFKLAPILLKIIEATAINYNLTGYLELTGGGGKVIANLDQSVFSFRLYNEWELGLTNLMACLTDDDKTTQLISTIVDKLASYPDTKELFTLACENKDKENIDMVLSAAYTYIAVYGSMSANRTSYSEAKFNKMLSRKNYLKLHKLNPYLKGVTVTKGDCFYLLDYYKDRYDVFGYIDPPYFGTSSYENNWKPENYERLVQMSLQSKMKIMISDYHNPYYDTLLDYGWKKHFLKTLFISSSHYKNSWKDEHIWVNFDIPQLLLPCNKVA